MKVLCKKTVTRENPSNLAHFSISDQHFISFLAGEYYNITKNDNRTIYIEDILFWYTFPTMDGLYFFEDYFYTNQELRKLKLDKINESIV